MSSYLRVSSRGIHCPFGASPAKRIRRPWQESWPGPFWDWASSSPPALPPIAVFVLPRSVRVLQRCGQVRHQLDRPVIQQLGQPAIGPRMPVSRELRCTLGIDVHHPGKLEPRVVPQGPCVEIGDIPAANDCDSHYEATARDWVAPFMGRYSISSGPPPVQRRRTHRQCPYTSTIFPSNTSQPYARASRQERACRTRTASLSA